MKLLKVLMYQTNRLTEPVVTIQAIIGNDVDVEALVLAAYYKHPQLFVGPPINNMLTIKSDQGIGYTVAAALIKDQIELVSGQVLQPHNIICIGYQK